MQCIFRLTLPDVVAATTKVGSQDSQQQQQQHHHHKHRHKEFEELAEENQRLKSIFQLHSIKISENTKSRRNSDPDLYTNSSCDKNKGSHLKYFNVLKTTIHMKMFCLLKMCLDDLIQGNIKVFTYTKGSL